MKRNIFLTIMLIVTLLSGLIVPVSAEATVKATDVIGGEYVDLYEGVSPYEGTIGDTYADGWARIPGVDFSDGVYDTLDVTYSCAKGYSGGKMFIYLDSRGGALIAELTVENTESWENYKTVSLEMSNPNINGVHDVYITFSKRTTGTFKSMQFKAAETGRSIPSDIEGTELEDTALKLEAFGLISLGSSQYRPDDVIKNSEVIAAVKNISEYFDMSEEKMTAEYSVNVNSNATQQDIMKIFAIASGYIRFPDYMTYMHEEGIFTGVQFKYGNITRGEFLKCMDNFLDMRVWVYNNDEMYRSDTTILEKFLKIRKSKGIVMSDTYTAIVGTPLKEVVYIGDNTYYKNGFDTDKFIGQNVEFYCTDDDEPSIVFMYGYNNEIIELDDEHTERFSGMTIYYTTDSGKQKRYDVSDDFVLILNSKVVSKFDKSLFETFNGTLKIIDNDKDASADVIIMRDTYDIYVDGFADNIIYGKDKSVLDLNDKEIIIRKASGVLTDETYLSNIKKGTVLTVAYSDAADGTPIYDITVSNINIKGILESIYEDEDGKTVLRVSGTEYKVSKLCTADFNNLTGEEVNIYLNAMLEIADIAKNVFESVYGYALKYFYNEDDEKNYVKIFGEDNIMHTFVCAERLKIDGKSYKTEEQKAALKNAFTESVVVYLLNDRGQLAGIDFPYQYTGFKQAVGLNEYETDNSLYLSFEGSALYRWYGRSFAGKSILATNAIVFLIPQNDEPDQYRAVDAESYFSDQETYEIKAYGTDTKSFASPVYSISYDGVPQISSDSSVMFVKSVGIDNYFNNDTEEIMSTLEYMRDGQIFKEYVDADGKSDLAAIEPGDIIKIGHSLDGYVTKIVHVFDASSATVLSGSETFNSPTRYICDSILKIEGNYAILNNFDEIVNLSCNNIYIYNKNEVSRNKIKQGSISELVSVVHESGASKVFVSQRYGETNGVLIVQE